MLVPIWKGHVTDEGRLVMNADEAQLRSRYLLTLAGQDIEIVLRRARKNPTVGQERYLRGFVLPLLKEHFGYLTDDEMLRDLMGHRFGWDQSKNSAIPLREYSTLSQEEKGEFISWVIIWAQTEHNVEIPDANRATTA